MTRALVLGGSGFIGSALTKRLKAQGAWVRAVDVRRSPFDTSAADEFDTFDLRNELPYWLALATNGQPFDEVYQLACDVGGAGYIFGGQHDADIVANNVRINANVAQAFGEIGCGRLVFTSSACVYADTLGVMRGQRALCETHAACAQPSNGYGWEKLFSEKLYEAHRENCGLNVGIARFATIYGPGSPFEGGRENAVSAICRKVIDAPQGGEVEVWGDGAQVRPLVYIDDLLDAITGLMRHKGFGGPVNIATAELTTCNDIAGQAIALSGKRLTIKNVPGPTGKQVLHMTTDLAEKHLGWRAKAPFAVGLERTFAWIAGQKAKRAAA